MYLKGMDERIDTCEFPATTDDVIATHGNVSLPLADGMETVEDVLGRLGDETYDCPADLRAALRAGVSADAVGRQRYSDRDAATPGENEPDPVSF